MKSYRHARVVLSAATFFALGICGLRAWGQTVYDFSGGGGVDHFAYGTYTDSWSQDLDGQRRKCPEVCTEVNSVTPNAYLRLAYSDATGGDIDANRYWNPDEGSADESTLIVEFNITEPPELR